MAESQLSRRHMLSGFVATSTATWVAPVVVGWDRIGAAAGSLGLMVTGDATIATLEAGQSLRPESVEWSSNTQFYVFEEQSVVLDAPQTTDSGMVLPAGEPICSYLIHYSPSSGNATLSGTVDFGGTIIGYDWEDATLAAGDTTWGVPGVLYGTTRRRMEWPGNDTLSFTLPSNLSLTMFAGSSFVDQIRVYVVY